MLEDPKPWEASDAPVCLRLCWNDKTASGTSSSAYGQAVTRPTDDLLSGRAWRAIRCRGGCRCRAPRLAVASWPHQGRGRCETRDDAAAPFADRERERRLSIAQRRRIVEELGVAPEDSGSPPRRQGARPYGTRPIRKLLRAGSGGVSSGAGSTVTGRSWRSWLSGSTARTDESDRRR